jgi:predicted metal-dependent hydrolase
MSGTHLHPRYRIQFGSEEIEFHLKTSHRKTLAISVHPDSTVWVVAPEGATLEKILQKVKKRAPWILKQKAYFSRFLPERPPARYRSGESYYYLGRQYRLKTHKGSKESVVLKNGFLEAVCGNPEDNLKIRGLLHKWYRARAIEYFGKQMKRWQQQIKDLDGHSPRLKLRQMKTRWGSCTVNGIITLNQNLIHSPSHCIEYVIAHELCHLRYRNHGAKFLALMNRVMPDWRMRRRRLEELEIYR